MIQVTVEGKKREYEAGASLLEAARECQPEFPYEILLAVVNGKLQELHRPMREGDQIHFLTARDKPGMQAYERSLTMLLMKAFYHVVGKERIQKVTVDFSVGGGLFLEPEGDFALDEELVRRVREQMRVYVDAAIPIVKRNVHTDEAIELFYRNRMFDKARLFQYRRVSRVNLYGMDGFEDYYYGYMVRNTSCLGVFDLRLYRHGMVLLLPDRADPSRLQGFIPREKLFQALKESGDWGRMLHVSTVGELNQLLSRGEMDQLIQVQEALMEKKMGDIAEQIAHAPDKKFVMIAGPSSSGKTTFSHRLSIQLRAKGLNPHPIAVDNYFVNRKDSPRDEDGNYNYEALECIDVELFNRDMTALLAGETVELPVYNFISGEREYRGDRLTLREGDILVIEGIHCLNERLSYSLPKENKFKIYISALTQLNIDEHNRIPTTDGRLIRRIIRDARTRGSSAQETIRMWPSVRKGEEENIFPFQEEADVMFNSALVYELSVLKQYAEPILFGVPRDSEEYMEAKRLLKFLDYFLGVSSERIPTNSILREFIGGSCFRV